MSNHFLDEKISSTLRRELLEEIEQKLIGADRRHALLLVKHGKLNEKTGSALLERLKMKEAQ